MHGDSADCGNYKSLAVFSTPSKVAESVMRYCMTINQWGNRNDISSGSLLRYLTETWNHLIDQGNVIGAIFTDFRKAFDSVCPVIWSHKLQYCGISGNIFRWLNSMAFPQGSLHGPRLFSIYVNGFPDCITQGELHLYADDATASVIGDILMMS